MVLVGLSGTAFAQSVNNDDEYKSGTFVVTTSHTMYMIPYSITNGTVDEITPICDVASAIVLFTSDQSGRLTLDIPRNMLNSNYDGTDADFFVLLDGEEIDFEETGKAHSREITLSFEPGAHALEIITTWGMSLEIEMFACKAAHDPPYSYILPPLRQSESGSPYHETVCKPGLQLTQKHDGSPACVKPETVFELIKRDWTSNIIKAIQSRDISSDIVDATSSYMDRIIPTLDDFKNTLSKPYDIDEIFSMFGDPHDDIGSGIHIYVYELNDFTEVWIGYADDIMYVTHVDAEGNELEELFCKKDRIKNNI